LVLLSVLVLPQLASAAPSRVTLSGDLVGLSAASRTVSVRSAGGAQVILRVTNSSSLKRNGATIQITGLALRDRVNVQYVVASSALVTLKAQGPPVNSTRGTLTALDTAAGRIDLRTPSGARTFLLGPTTLIVRNGRAAAPQDLTLRDTLLVHTRAGARNPATALDVESDGPETDEVEGTISAIADPDVTITPEHGSAVVVHVVAATMIELHDHGTETAGTLADLAVGQHAESHFDPATNNAMRIDVRVADGAHSLRVEGTVTAIDPTASTLTITPHTGSPVDLTTDSHTRISLNEASATLADIPIGARAHARYDGTTLVASEIEAETEDEHPERQVEGLVTAVSTTGITIAPQHGAPVALTVDRNTVIRINGHAAALADIPVGARAHGKYDGTTLLASRIDAVVVPANQLREVEGNVTASSATSLTIAPHHGSAVVLVLDATTVIVRDGHPATAADIHVGDEAEARYEAATLLAKSVRVHAED
jgi:hypothetical protein